MQPISCILRRHDLLVAVAVLILGNAPSVTAQDIPEIATKITFSRPCTSSELQNGIPSEQTWKCAGVSVVGTAGTAGVFRQGEVSTTLITADLKSTLDTPDKGLFGVADSVGVEIFARNRLTPYTLSLNYRAAVGVIRSPAPTSGALQATAYANGSLLGLTEWRKTVNWSGSKDEPFSGTVTRTSGSQAIMLNGIDYYSLGNVVIRVDLTSNWFGSAAEGLSSITVSVSRIPTGPLTISSVASAQISEADCNSVNRRGEHLNVDRKNWPSNDPLLFGVKEDGLAHLSVDLDGTSPASIGSDVRIGILSTGSGKIESSVAPSKTSTRTEITFAPLKLYSSEHYKVVLGRIDPNTNQIDPSALLDTFPIPIVPVSDIDYESASVSLQALAWLPNQLSTLSGTFLNEFLKPDDPFLGFSPPAASSLQTADPRLTHPTGLTWTSNCSAPISLYSAQPDSVIHDALADSEQFAYVIRQTLNHNMISLQQVANQGGVGGPYPFSATIAGDGGGFNQWSRWRLPTAGSQLDLFYSVNQIEVTGTVKVNVDKSTRTVMHVLINATATDLIDFDIRAGELSRLGAIVQAGHPSAGNRGRAGAPFLVQIEINIDSDTYDFYPARWFKSKFEVPN